MRKIILFMHLSLDGYVGGPNGEMDWIDLTDNEMDNYMGNDLLKDADSMLLGRNLYQGFEQAWPAMGQDPNSPKIIVDFANWIINSPKLVFSSTPQNFTWTNTRSFVVNNDQDIVDAITKLKQEPGKDFVIFGGAQLAQTLIKLELIDEYRFKLEPVILGSGLSLFKDVTAKQKLELVKSRSFDSGIVTLYYKPVKEA